MKQHLLLFAIAVLLVTCGCATQKPIYEYRIFHTVQGVNEHASEGWEVVNFTTRRDGSREFLVRRPRKAFISDAR